MKTRPATSNDHSTSLRAQLALNNMNPHTDLLDDLFSGTEDSPGI